VDAFKYGLSRVLETLSNSEDPNIVWNDWKVRFLAVADMHAPQITCKVKNQHIPWITPGIGKNFLLMIMCLRTILIF
jgi:hypothetical protein